MRFGRGDKQGGAAKLQMVPMIDIVFQLLIFFLVGTKMRVPEGELEAYLPPEGQPRERHQRIEEIEEIRVTLRVAQGGDTNPDVPPIVLLDDTTAKTGVKGGSMIWLEGELKSMGEKNPAMREKVPIIIEAEPHLAYAWVIKTLDICRKAKFQKVNFAASKRGAPAPAAASGAAPPG